MPAVVLTVQDTKDFPGGEPTYTAPDAVDGVQFTNDGKTRLWIDNGAAAAITYNIPTTHKMHCAFSHPYPDPGLEGTADEENNDAPANMLTLTHKFSIARFGALVQVKFSSVTNVTVAAVRTSEATFGGVA